MSLADFELALTSYSAAGEKPRFFIKKDFPMRNITSFRIGGDADMVVYPSDGEAFCYALETAKAISLPYIVIGNGSNTLASDRGFRGIVFVTTDMRKVQVEGNLITGGCGVLLGSIGTNSRYASLTGFEFANGIPGTLGGAVYMNAGAYGGQMSDIVQSTVCYELDSNDIITLSNKDHRFAYRHSIFMDKNYIVLSSTLKLAHGDRREIEAKMRENLIKRREKQPLEYPSAGSVFKRPLGHFAGRLIEEAGLKGISVGGASVSEKHAGFIVNRGGATANDVLSLIEIIKHRVYLNSGVELECEIRCIGDF